MDVLNLIKENSEWTALLLPVFHFGLGIYKTKKVDVDALYGIFTLFMDRFKPILEKQNHYNPSEPDLPEVIKTQISDIVKDEVIKKVDSATVLSTPIFSHPKPNFRITSKFGIRVLKSNGKEFKDFHNGIDLGGFGDCFAIEDCIIEKIVLPDPQYPSLFKWDDKQGWISAGVPKGRGWTPYISLIGIYTGNRYCYKHVETNKDLSVGMSVKSGQAICKTGQLGYCMGAHLHFEIQQKKDNSFGDFIDPEKFLKEKGII